MVINANANLYTFVLQPMGGHYVQGHRPQKVGYYCLGQPCASALPGEVTLRVMAPALLPPIGPITVFLLT
jgi:hypothetical protein